MDEKELEQDLKQLGQEWRVAPEPPLDRMWAKIEDRALQAPARREWHWVRRSLPLAATLVLGFGLGRITPSLTREQPGDGSAAAVAGQADSVPVRPADNAPFVGVATNYLERVTALLVTLAAESRRGESLEYTTAQARDLLATTRLMMDAPEPIEPRLRTLLEDLEQVLAQIVQLPRRPSGPDVSLIDQALDQREVLPRLRVFLAEHNPSMP